MMVILQNSFTDEGAVAKVSSKLGLWLVATTKRKKPY